MKSWLKYTFLGFFNHEASLEGETRSFSNVFLGLLLYFLLLVLALTGGFSISVDYQLNHAKDLNNYISFLSNQTTLNLEVTNHQLKSDLVICSFEENTDYSSNSFNVIVDTRDIDSIYVDFDLSCKDKSGNDVMYLPTYRDSKDYTFSVDIKKNEVDILGNYDTYIEFVNKKIDPSSDIYDKTVKDAVDNLASDLSEDNYKKAIYEIYVQSYFPNLTNCGSYNIIPTLRSYYYGHYLMNDKVTNSLYLLKDLAILSFENDKKQTIEFEGYFSKLKDKVYLDSSILGEKRNNSLKALVKDAFSNSTDMVVTVYLINLFTVFPLVAIFGFALSLILSLIFKLKKMDFTISGTYKTTCNFNTWSIISAALVAFILSIFLPRGMAYQFTLYTYFIVYALRCAAYLILRLFKNKKIEDEVVVDQQEGI